MNAETYAVRIVEGLELKVGDMVWIQKPAHIYSAGGYFAEVESVMDTAPDKYTNGIIVTFRHDNRPHAQETWTFWSGTGANEEVLVLV